MNMAFVFLLTIIQWTVLISSVRTQDLSRKLELLRDRLMRLETRLGEDIATLREEFYVEINSAVKDPLYGEGTDRVVNVPKIDFQEDFQAFQESVFKKILQFQLGLSDEKRLRRAIQFELKDVKDQEDRKQAVLAELLEEVRGFQKLITDNNARGSFNISKTITEKLDVLGNRIDVKPDLIKITEMLQQIVVKLQSSVVPRSEEKYNDCAELLRNGFSTSGVYTVYPDTMWRPLKVYCDMTTDGGGWTVFQRRKDGSENFNRNWIDYTFGFGDLKGEFWLGNEFLHRLTKRAPQELRIDLEDFDNERREAKYGDFSIGPATDYFKLKIDFYSGDAVDSLATHNGAGFSTSDRGPSSGCSQSYKGGWWYTNCHSVNVNGLYLKGEHKSYADGVNWQGWKGYHYSLKFTEMKFRSK